MIKYLNLLLFAGMIYMNYLANALPLNHKTTGQLSDSYPNLFVPSGITFSIWGAIYILLAVYCIIQFRLGVSLPETRIGWIFAITCVLNALWIVCWHYEKLGLSILIMFSLLVSLIFIAITIKDLPFGSTKAAFGIYLGWICIASIANITALLVYKEWNGFGISQESWTIIMIFTGALIAAFSIYKFKNPFIGVAVIWAFAGIILKRYTDHRLIAMMAGLALLILAAVTVSGFITMGQKSAG
ncbi:MAG: tryptophan-rich sensory protein [Bacteroidales bacterium]|nr:tryptophan-rich sensory protein [Bacteroidales bacterium]